MNATTFNSIHLTFQQSGMSIAAFCRDHGIPLHSFYYWRKKNTAAAASTTRADFIEIRPAPNDSAPLSFHGAPMSSTPLQLVVGPATFHLTEGFSKNTLIQSLEALREAKLC